MDIDTIVAAYKDFMAAKYPDDPPPDQPIVKFFDPGDDVPDHGLAFLMLPREQWLKDRDQKGLKDSLMTAKRMRHKPPEVGYYLNTGSSWLFIAPTPPDAVLWFDTLKSEIVNVTA